MNLQAAFLLSVCIVSETAEQMLFRMSGKRPDKSRLFAAGGIGLYIVSFFFWILLLHVAPLGIAMPLMASSHITVALASRFFFREKIDRRRWIGIALVSIGVAIVARLEQ